MKAILKKKMIIVLSLALILAFTTSLGSIEVLKADSNDLSLQLIISNSPKPMQIDYNYSFIPFDLVYMTANVTYLNYPQPNVPVTFKITGPANTSNPIIRTGLTSQNGSTTVSFRIPMDNYSNPTIGIWNYNCTAGLLNQTAKANSNFKVSWPITIQSIKLLDENGTESNSFSKGQNPKLRIEVIKANSHAVDTTLIVNITDSANNQWNIINQNNILKDNQTIINDEFIIANEYSTGEAKLDCYLISLNEGQNLEQALSKGFSIKETNDPNQPPNGSTTYRDLSLKDPQISSNQIIKGDILKITTTVTNKGNRTEQSTMHFFYGNLEAGSTQIELNANQEKTVTYEWNTTNVSPQTYLLTVRIDAVQDEEQTSDNEITSGSVTITEHSADRSSFSSTSLYVLTLFIVGSTTFSLLSILRWRKSKTPIVKVPIVMEEEDQEEIDRRNMPIYNIPNYQTDKTVTAKEITYSSVLPTLPNVKIASAEHIQPAVLPSKGQSERDNLEQIGKDRLTDELEQFKMKSLELLPLSAKSIDLSIQKIKLLQNSKITSERLRHEFEEIERIIDLQTESIQNELDRLKQSAEKLRSLSKSKKGNKDQPQSKYTKN